jgi:tetrahedral aminopeptidase
MPEMFELVREFTERPGPIGHEEEFNRWLADRWRPLLETSEVDDIGNFYGRVGGEGPRVLLVAHSDEIGFAVRSIDEQGFIRVASGQRDPMSRPFQRGPYFLPLGHPMLILGEGEPVEGVFATVTGHVLTPQQQEQFRLEWKDVFIDIGVGSRQEAEALGIQIGSRIIWNPPTKRRNKVFVGKAMDDRAALAILEQFLTDVDKATLGCELWVASTVMEEMGTIGAASVNNRIEARFSIAIDVALCGDIPTVDWLDVPVKLGGGPVIVQKDLLSYTRSVTRAIEAAANGAEIPFQRAVFNLYGSDAGELIRNGVASALIAYPTRYTHSPFETVHEDDLLACVQLLHATVASPFWRDTGASGAKRS